MRVILALLLAMAGAAVSPQAKADPYKWCADYGAGSDGGGTNCYFVTLQQCQWAISGNGGACRPNGFYDGRPVAAPNAPQTRRRTHQG